MSFDQAVVKELRKRATDECAGLMASLAKGQVVDWSDYRYIVGRIQGLNSALDFIDAIETDLRKG